MWKHQFETLRDGDRFFYLNDPELAHIEQDFGITFRHTLADIISLNSGARVPADVFGVLRERRLTTDRRSRRASGGWRRHGPSDRLSGLNRAALSALDPQARGAPSSLH
jgi:hypothetical protein